LSELSCSVGPWVRRPRVTDVQRPSGGNPYLRSPATDLPL
jgi:hypothetical protein